MFWDNDFKAWFYTGIEYQEVLRKKYNLPDDWKPEPVGPQKIRRSDVEDPDNPSNRKFFEMMEENGYLEPED